jgi:hypothetical protein
MARMGVMMPVVVEVSGAKLRMMVLRRNAAILGWGGGIGGNGAKGQERKGAYGQSLEGTHGEQFPVLVKGTEVVGSPKTLSPYSERGCENEWIFKIHSFKRRGSLAAPAGGRPRSHHWRTS